MRSPCLFICLTCALIAANGCAGFNARNPAIADVRAQREAREQATIESFERGRAAAEMSAAQLRFQQADFGECVRILNTLLTRSPAHAGARQLLAEAQLALGDVAAAEQTLRSLLADEPDNPNAREALDLLIASSSSLEAAQPVIRDERGPPESAGAEQLLARAVAEIRKGDNQSAIKILKTCAIQSPIHPKVLPTLAIAHLNEGESGAAQVVLQRAVSLDNAEPLSYFLLGHLLEERGDARGATECFRSAEQLDAHVRR